MSIGDGPPLGRLGTVLKILVANAKGGCGKTTIATQLAAALARAGHIAALADVDRQRSSLGWLARRPPDAKSIAGLDWSKEIGKPGNSVERLIVDAAPALRGKRIAELVKLADLIVVPVQPSSFDEAATRRFLDRIEEIGSIAKGRKPVALVGNRMRSGTRAAGRLERFLGGLGHPIVARLRDSQSYPDDAAKGLGLFDSSSSRTIALRTDWQPLLEFVAHAAER
jgi:chromosome partitioning protein